MASPRIEGGRATTRLKQLIHRQGKVLAVMHPPTAAQARIMERRLRGAVRRHRRGGRRLYRPGRCRHRDDDRMRADRRLDREQRDDPGDHRRRHRAWRHHGGAPPGARMHPRRHRRHPHRRPADRGQAHDAERRRRGGAAGPGDRALSRRGRHEERARSGFRHHGAVLCARRGEWRAGGCAAAADGLPRRGRRRLGAARIAAFDRRDQAGAAGRVRAVLVHEGQACRAISRSTSIWRSASPSPGSRASPIT